MPPSWVPRMCARYATYNIDVLNAFDHFGTLFDAVEGHKDAFKTSMEGIEQDAYGPQVNVRDELVAHMGNRITLITDYSMPISVNSERSLIAIEAKDEKKLAETIAPHHGKGAGRRTPRVRRLRDLGTRAGRRRDPRVDIDAPGLSPLHRWKTSPGRRGARRGTRDAEFGRLRGVRPTDDGLRHQVPGRPARRLRPARAAHQQRRLPIGRCPDGRSSPPDRAAAGRSSAPTKPFAPPTS